MDSKKETKNLLLNHSKIVILVKICPDEAEVNRLKISFWTAEQGNGKIVELFCPTQIISEI